MKGPSGRPKDLMSTGAMLTNSYKKEKLITATVLLKNLKQEGKKLWQKACP